MTEPKITYSDGVVTIVAELDPEGEESTSGKTMVLSSTHGNQKLKTPDGDISIGLNIFRKKV